MANLDTREKRSSGLHAGLPWRGLFPLPDGTLSQADRQHASYMYSGILAAGGVVPEPEVVAPSRDATGPGGGDAVGAVLVWPRIRELVVQPESAVAQCWALVLARTEEPPAGVQGVGRVHVAVWLSAQPEPAVMQLDAHLNAPRIESREDRLEREIQALVQEQDELWLLGL